MSLLLRRGLRLGVLVGVGAVVLAGKASAEDPLDFAHTLLVRRPLMEREIETQVSYGSGPSGREAQGTTALDLTLLPRWQIELTVPVLAIQPKDAATTAGVGDLVLENKFLLWVSRDRPFMVSAGVDVVMPTGSMKRHLGGTSGATLFAVAGTKVAGFDVLGDLSYQWLFDDQAPGRDTQTIQSTLAIARPVRPWLAPFFELRMTTQVVGSELGTGPRLRDRPELIGTPGVNITLAAGRTLLIGIELPLTHARRLDYGPRVGLVWDF